MNSSAGSSSSMLCSSPRVSTDNTPLQSIPPSPLNFIFELPNAEDEALADPTIGAQECSAAKSIWDADDDEFDRWPGEQDLKITMKSLKLQRETCNRVHRPESMV
jgi:hypothetical protein